MFRAIGIILVIWFLSTEFNSSFKALDRAATATFDTIEAAALKSQNNLE